MEAISEKERFLQSLRGKTIAVVIAHPDDEALWFGELLKSIECDIYCCMTPNQDPQRAVKWFEVCKKVNAKPVLLPFFEMDWIDLSKYDVVITHNEKGEYGHKDHVFVHNYVKNNFDGQIIVSGYGIDGNISFPADKEDLIKTYDYDWYGKPRYGILFKNWGTKFNLNVESYYV